MVTRALIEAVPAAGVPRLAVMDGALELLRGAPPALDWTFRCAATVPAASFTAGYAL